MSSIDHIHALAIYSYKGDELKPSTKLRLEALGIDPASVQTEAQAQILIAQAEAAPRENNSGNRQGGNSSREQLIFEAKELANEVGVSVSSKDTLEDIIENIAEVLNAQEPSKKVQEYQSRLANLAQRAEVLVTIQQNIFNEMEMISVSNRLILGL